MFNVDFTNPSKAFDVSISFHRTWHVQIFSAEYSRTCVLRSSLHCFKTYTSSGEDNFKISQEIIPSRFGSGRPSIHSFAVSAVFRPAENQLSWRTELKNSAMENTHKAFWWYNTFHSSNTHIKTCTTYELSSIKNSHKNLTDNEKSSIKYQAKNSRALFSKTQQTLAIRPRDLLYLLCLVGLSSFEFVKS